MSAGRAFAFAADASLRPWSRLFLVHPEICTVQLSDTELTVAFGRWTLSTSPANVVDVSITGPYTWWKVAGPAHLSVGDRGVTFATTTERGVCLSFAEPVPAIDPLGIIRHPNATITVADPDGFVAALREAMGRGAATDGTVTEVPGSLQGTYRASAVAVMRWQRRGDSVHHDRRRVEAIGGPGQEQGSPEVQRYDDGVGPAFHRRYAVVIDGADVDASGAMGRVQADLNRVSNEKLAPINKIAGEFGSMSVGDRYVVALAGPWSGPVEILAVGPDCFRLATLEGHLEAGVIEFRTEDRPDGSLGFAIESWARSGDHALRFLYDILGIAQALQSEMWVELCEAIAPLVDGTQRGPVEVLTERADAE